MIDINRRILIHKFLIGTIAAFTPAANAQQCRNSYPTKDGCAYRLALNFPYNPSSQATEMWCWAASIEGALAYQNIDFVSQEQIVERLFGSRRVQPANAEEIIRAASGLWIDAANSSFRTHVTANFISGNNRERYIKAAHLLYNDTPVIVCYSQPGFNIGHAVLLTNIVTDFSYNHIVRTTVFDPWANNGFRQLTPEEGNNTFALISIKAAVV